MLKSKISDSQKTLFEDSEIRICVCIDMDCFYAQVDSKKLGIDKAVPFATIHYKYLATCNYAAKTFGVRKGMPLEKAKELCPNLVIYHPEIRKIEEDKNTLIEDPFINETYINKINLDHYREESEKFIKLLNTHCGIVEKASIDEAYLDITKEVLEYRDSKKYYAASGKIIGSENNFVDNISPLDELVIIGSYLVDKIRKNVFEIFGYTCSAGISYNKLLCKLGSNLNKPDGQSVILERHTLYTMKLHDILKVRGFGGKYGKIFEQANIKRIEDALNIPIDQLNKIFESSEVAKYIYKRLRGYCNEPISAKKIENKCLMSSKTFHATNKIEDIQKVQNILIMELSMRLVQLFEEFKMVPRTLILYYTDKSNDSYKSKSKNVNFLVKKENFEKILHHEVSDMLQPVLNFIFPCEALGIGVKDFIKSDINEFKFDLFDFAKRNILEIQDSEKFNKNNQEIDILETRVCPKCEKIINANIYDLHVDFHFAEELDKDLNPNKRKYKQIVQENSTPSTNVKNVKKNTNEAKIQPLKIDSFFKKIAKP